MYTWIWTADWKRIGCEDISDGQLRLPAEYSGINRNIPKVSKVLQGFDSFEAPCHKYTILSCKVVTSVHGSSANKQDVGFNPVKFRMLKPLVS